MVVPVRDVDVGFILVLIRILYFSYSLQVLNESIQKLKTSVHFGIFKSLSNNPDWLVFYTLLEKSISIKPDSLAFYSFGKMYTNQA